MTRSEHNNSFVSERQFLVWRLRLVRRRVAKRLDVNGDHKCSNTIRRFNTHELTVLARQEGTL